MSDVAEHVYEAQLIRRFFDWLIDDTLPVGYTNPTYGWVSEVLLGCYQITMSKRVFKHPRWGQDRLWYEMVFGLGSDSEPHLLALADRGVNGRKKSFFAREYVPASNEKTNRATRISQRNVCPFSHRLEAYPL